MKNKKFSIRKVCVICVIILIGLKSGHANDLINLQIRVWNCHFKEITLLSYGSASIIKEITNPDSIYTFIVNSPPNENQLSGIISFTNGPEFQIVLNDRIEIDINFQQAFDFDNMNPKVYNSPHTIELWSFFDKANSMSRDRLSFSGNVEEKLNNEFTYLKSVCLETSSPIIAGFSYGFLKLRISSFEILNDKKSEMNFLANYLNSKYPNNRFLKFRIKGAKLYE